MRDSFPISSIRISAQRKPLLYQVVGIVITLVAMALLIGGTLCYKYADTAIWRITACPKCHRVYSRKNRRMRYSDMEKQMDGGKELPHVSDLCKACFIPFCNYRLNSQPQQPTLRQPASPTVTSETIDVAQIVTNL